MRAIILLIINVLFVNSVIAQTGVNLKAFKDSSGNYGYKNDSGVVVIIPQFSAALDFTEGLGAVKLIERYHKENVVVYIDANSKIILKLGKTYGSSLYPFVNGFAIANQFNKKEGNHGKELLGMIDKKGKTVVPFKYEYIYKEDSVTYKLQYVEGTDFSYSKYGALNLQTMQEIPCIYDGLNFLSNGRFIAKKNGYEKPQFFFVGFNNKATEFNYTSITSGEKIISARNASGKFGLMNHNLETIIPFEYEAGFTYGGKDWITKKGGKYGMIDLKENVIIPFEYEEVFKYGGKNYFIAKKDGDYGMIDLKGNMITPFRYDKLDFFNENLIQITDIVKDDIGSSV